MRYLAIALLLLAACEQRKGPAAEMKPAESWSAQGQANADPHAGVDLGAAQARADDPHQGLDIGHGGDPHAGIDMTGPGGLPAPDPDRPIDPTKFLKGTIALGNGMKAPASSVVFLAVRPAAGGPPIAVDVIENPRFPLAFALDEGKAMVGGTAFSGEVVISARVDQDSDVDTRQPGDLSGKVSATIPAEGLALTLDTVQP